MANVPSSPVENRASSMQFPFLDLKAEYAEMKAEIRAAVDKVLESQQFIMGPQVREFEADIASLVGSKFALGCASGSDALLLPLMALGVDAGDEVVTTPFTFVATAGTISRLKATPVFVDIDPASYNLDVKLLETAITPRTKAIIPVHLFGLPADMDAVTAIGRALTACRSLKTPPSPLEPATVAAAPETLASLAASVFSLQRILAGRATAAWSQLTILKARRAGGCRRAARFHGEPQEISLRFTGDE